jgi:hypothetical protein
MIGECPDVCSAATWKASLEVGWSPSSRRLAAAVCCLSRPPGLLGLQAPLPGSALSRIGGFPDVLSLPTWQSAPFEEGDRGRLRPIATGRGRRAESGKRGGHLVRYSPASHLAFGSARRSLHQEILASPDPGRSTRAAER